VSLKSPFLVHNFYKCGVGRKGDGTVDCNGLFDYIPQGGVNEGRKLKSKKTNQQGTVPTNIDLSGSWDGHVNAVRPAIMALDRRRVEAIAAAPLIVVTNDDNAGPVRRKYGR
jgi:hypothetical protein